ncbi:MAG: hypothetical protein AB1298_00295 [Bacteroidota bacterium]
MKKIQRGVTALAFACLIVFLINACSSTKEAAEKKQTLKGKIIVIGNEPFTKLALQLDNEKVYLLKCKDDLEKKLWRNQGIIYSIDYSKEGIDGDLPFLIVEDATPVVQNTK